MLPLQALRRSEPLFSYLIARASARLHAFSHSKPLWKFISVAELALELIPNGSRPNMSTILLCSCLFLLPPPPPTCPSPLSWSCACWSLPTSPGALTPPFLSLCYGCSDAMSSPLRSSEQIPARTPSLSLPPRRVRPASSPSLRF